MKTPQLLVDGKPIRLGKRIGKGGEGEVYLVDGSNQLALKYYTVSNASHLEPKIHAMVHSRIADKSNFVAFPIAIVHSQSGKFAGFLMRLIAGHHPLHEVYSPAARKTKFPRVDYRFLVRTAANIARAVASVHKAGCVIGDINHSGILISNDATATLIDADSFQITDGKNQYLCRVGVPEYTPPELQSTKLSGVVRTYNHDAFGLAVVIFQLLFMGRHPFVGIYANGDLPLERAIAEYRFAYSSRDVGMKSPPGTAKLTDFPQAIATAFESAFGFDQSVRPSAENWVDLLVELEHSLRRCASNDLHYFPAVASHCPWCRMESQLGIVLFLPHFGSVGGPTLDPSAGAFNLSAVWTDIESVRLPKPGSFQPALPDVSSTPSADIKAEVRNRRLTGVVLFLLSIGVAAIAPGFWLIYILLGWVAYKKIFEPPECASAVFSNYRNWQEQWFSAYTQWQTKCGVQELETLIASLRQAKVDYESLPSEFQNRISLYQRNRQAIQCHRYLDKFQIHDASIRGIGQARKAALASFGIETAADITIEKVLAIPGFGENNSLPLFRWKKSLETAFVYDTQPNAFDKKEHKRIQSELDAKAFALRRKLQSGANDLKVACQTALARTKSVDPVLSRLHGERSQLEADLKYLRISVPDPPPSLITTHSVGNPPATPTYVNATPPSYSNVSPSNVPPSCPSCGSRMVRRTAKRGSNAGRPFYGCSKYPNCRGTRAI